MNKKGFLGDFPIYVILIFILAIALTLIYVVVSVVNTAWQTVPNDQAKSMLQNFKDRYVGVWDGFMLFMIIGLVIVIIILAMTIRSHPVFAIFGIILMVFLGMIGVHFANVFNDYKNTETIGTYVSEFTFTSYIMEKLPHIVVILFVMFIIVLFAKTRSSGVNL